MECPIKVEEVIRKGGIVTKAIFLGLRSNVLVTVVRELGEPRETSRKPANPGMMSYHVNSTSLTPEEFKKYKSMVKGLFMEKRKNKG